MTRQNTVRYAQGALFGLAAVAIWAGWIVASRVGLRTSLTPWDIAAIRFSVGGSILAPYLWRRGLAHPRLGWPGLAALVIGGGAPMVLLANAGLLFAPAAHAGALFPGVMPSMVMILAALVLGESFTVAKSIGLALVLVGVFGVVWAAGGTFGTRQTLGHSLFLGAALLWATYTIAMRRAQLAGLHAAAIAAVGSLLFYVPAYAAATGMALLRATWQELLLQALVQGILTAVLSLLLYGRAINILGASSGAAFAALCPAMTALLGIPVLGEWPNRIEWTAILLISLGVYFASGGPLSFRANGQVT
jgi:drug/metabolite transporter (DMT)-like permease